MGWLEYWMGHAKHVLLELLCYPSDLVGSTMVVTRPLQIIVGCNKAMLQLLCCTCIFQSSSRTVSGHCLLSIAYCVSWCAAKDGCTWIPFHGPGPFPQVWANSRGLGRFHGPGHSPCMARFMKAVALLLSTYARFI